MAGKKKILQAQRDIEKARCYIKDLPVELLTEIFGMVGAKSLTSLMNAKRVCKYILAASEDDYVYQNLSIVELEEHLWRRRPEAISFYNRCIENNNPAALYRQGIIGHFSFSKYDTGLEYIKKAAEKGHAEATYLYGILLLCSGEDESKKRALEILAPLGSGKSRTMRTQEYRRRVSKSLRWTPRRSLCQQLMCSYRAKPCNCDGSTSRILDRRNNTWPSSDYPPEEDAKFCDTCFWDFEVNRFFNAAYFK